MCIAATAVAVAVASPEPSTKFAGKTSQGFSASIWTNAAGNGLHSFTIRRSFRCAGNETIEGTFQLTSGAMALREGDRFYAHAKVKRGGKIRRGVFTIRGRFGTRGKAARGTYRERVRVKSGARCDTGTIRFLIRARG